MQASYVTMWGLLILMAAGAAGELVTQGGLFGSLRAAYPSDLGRREALARCGQMDESFSRFSANDRENCYRVFLPASARAASNPPGAL